MIVLPIYLQMVFAYNALQAGLSIAPLSLSMFFIALLAGRRAGGGVRRPSSGPDSCCWRSAWRSSSRSCRAPTRAGADRAADHRGLRPGAARLAAQQLHALAHRRGARQRGGRGELGGRLVRAVVRARVRRARSCSRRSPPCSSRHANASTVLPRRSEAQVSAVLEEDAQIMSDAQLQALLAGEPPEVQAEIIRDQRRGSSACAPGRAARAAVRRAARLRELLPDAPTARPGAVGRGGDGPRRLTRTWSPGGDRLREALDPRRRGDG